jgi:hypothetical protein
VLVDEHVDIVQNFILGIPEEIGDSALVDVLNCYDTEMYFRALPVKTLSLKEAASKEQKCQKTGLRLCLLVPRLVRSCLSLVITKFENVL